MMRRDFTSEPARFRFVTAAAVCFCTVCVSTTAHGEVSLHGSLGITSDYVQSGLSETRGDPAVQGGVRADFGDSWSLGLWGSQIDRAKGSHATYELDAYLSR